MTGDRIDFGLLGKLRYDAEQQLLAQRGPDPYAELLIGSMDNIFQKVGESVSYLVGLRLADGRLAALYRTDKTFSPYLYIVAEDRIDASTNVLPATFSQLQERPSYTLWLGYQGFSYWANSMPLTEYPAEATGLAENRLPPPSSTDLSNQADWLNFVAQQIATAEVKVVI